MRRLVLAATAMTAACFAASAATAAPFDGAPPQAPTAASPTAASSSAELLAPLAIPGLDRGGEVSGEAILLAKKGGRPGGAGKRGGAPVRKPSVSRHQSNVSVRGGNNVVVNRGRPAYRGYAPGGRYYDDDDNDGLAGALVGGVIGLGVGAAIANSDDPDNTCVDNNGDGVCDAY